MGEENYFELLGIAASSNETNCSNSRSNKFDELLGIAASSNETNCSNSRSNKFDELPECVQELLEGLNVSGNSTVSLDSRPDWLDMDKFTKGQKFALKHWGGLCFGNMLMLLLGLSFRRLLEPLIFTGKSDSSYKAFKRYLATVSILYSWYRGNIWDAGDPARKNIDTVRTMHNHVLSRMSSISPCELRSKVALDGCGDEWCVDDDFLDEFRSCSLGVPNDYDFDTGVGGMFITQFDLAVTQLAFIAPLVQHPNAFGALGASAEELEGFVHFWRCVGYLLGIEDRFNVCRGSVELARNIAEHVSKRWVTPCFLRMEPDAEHMSRCMVKGLGYVAPELPFNTALVYVCWVQGIGTEKLLKYLTWSEWLCYFALRFVFGYLVYVPGVRKVINCVVRKAVA